LATTNTDKTFDCVLVGDRHHGLTEGVRGLLETMFKTVVMVADVPSLQATAGRLHPELAVVDISLSRDGSLHWLERLRQCCPETKLIVLSFHDEPSARQAALESGADGFVLTRAIVTELLPAIEAVLADGTARNMLHRDLRREMTMRISSPRRGGSND
jgi:DNA-binding NarL/FixJ family response regulator